MNSTPSHEEPRARVSRRRAMARHSSLPAFAAGQEATAMHAAAGSREVSVAHVESSISRRVLNSCMLPVAKSTVLVDV